MRQIVRAALPLGEGVVLDPFMGGGATIAAAVAVGYESIGIEIDPDFYRVARGAVPKLAALAGPTARASDEEEMPLLAAARARAKREG
jgi:site-specific DNA-methyltransferase (adenine-specific)